MGWRAVPLPPDWPQIRKRVLERDGHQCRAVTNGVRCTHEATDVHHTRGADDHSDDGLVSLCAWHHKRETSAQARAARGPRPTIKRPAEKHPGLL